MKTPEQMAEEYALDCERVCWRPLAAKDFLAGYRAAQEQHAGYVRRAEENHAAMEKKISHLADQQGYRDGVEEKLKELGIEIHFGNRK
jgi:hypothetical protein